MPHNFTSALTQCSHIPREQNNQALCFVQVFQFFSKIFQGFLGIIFAFAGAMMFNPGAMLEGVKDALDAGIRIVEIMEELIVS